MNTQAYRSETALLRRSSGWAWLWDVYTVGGCGAAIAIVVLLDNRFPGSRCGAAAAIVAIAIWTMMFGRDFLHSREFGRRAAVFATGLVILFTVALCFSPAAIAVLPVLYPLLFMSLPLRSALMVTAAVNLLPIAVALGSVQHQHLSLWAAISLIAFIISPVIGSSITITMMHAERQSELLDELAASRAESARLSRDAGTAAERERLARDIHDTLAQGFAGIITLSQLIETEITVDPRAAQKHLSLIETVARENLAEARAMVAAHTPSQLYDVSLIEAIRRQSERLVDDTDIVMTITAESPIPTVNTSSKIVLLRAAGEALTNARKHSKASAVAVNICETDDRIRLSLTDNGIGFNATDDTNGFGLRGMRSRVAQIGGTMTVSSHHGAGTTIVVEVPA